MDQSTAINGEKQRPGWNAKSLPDQDSYERRIFTVDVVAQVGTNEGPTMIIKT